MENKKNQLEEIFCKYGQFSNNPKPYQGKIIKPEPIGMPLVVSVKSIEGDESAEEENLKHEIWAKSVDLDFLSSSFANALATCVLKNH